MPAKAEILRRTSGPYHLDTYFLVCQQTGDSVIIDPGDDALAVIDFIGKKKITPTKLLHTHGHADQFFSTEVFKQTHNIPSCLHAQDNLFFKDPMVREETLRLVGLPPPYPADIELAHGDRISFGRQCLSVIHTPGHTPGSVCFLWKNNLFTGDALFAGEAGRTDLPGGNLVQLVASIRDRIMVLDKKTIIHPGHHHAGSSTQSTLEKEIRDNIYITDFILDT
jgi:hydroxyacylglutathione hydrolase